MVPEPHPGGRMPVAVLLSRFPSITETFILREVTEMERQGQPVRLVPLLRDHPPVVHPEARPWMGRALYTPFLSLAILRENLGALRRRPRSYVGLLVGLIASSLRHPRFLLGTLAIFPKSIYLAARLKSEGIRHVHAQFANHPATAAFIIAAFSDASFSVTIHAHDLFLAGQRPFLAAKLQAASFIRVISEFNRRFLLERFPEIAPDKIHVIHVGIPVEVYDPAEENPRTTRTGSGSGEPERPTSHGPVEDPGVTTEVLAVAGLRPHKGLHVLIEACQRLGDDGVGFRCDIIGEGPIRTELEDQIRDAGLEDRVRLLGAMTQGDVARELARRPVFVLPSVALPDGRMDGIPVALMEAMAAGAPAVSTRVSGIPELIEDGVSGVLVEPGDAPALADAIRRILENPTIARSLGEQGFRRVAADFSLDRCTRALIELIDGENPPLLPAFDPGTKLLATRLLYEGLDSRVVEVVVADREHSVTWVVKTHNDRPGQSRPPGDRARHEYQVLADLISAWSPDGGARSAPVPLPLEVDEKAGQVVMEALRGVRLDALLRQARTGGRMAIATACDAMEASGHWLRTFQQVTAPMGAPQTVAEDWIGEMRVNFRRAGPLLPPVLRDRIEVLLRDVETRPEQEALPTSGHHGDFWPGNVVATADGIRVIDFEGFRPGVVFEDAATFLLQAELAFDYPLLRARFPPMREAFLHGYGQCDLQSLEAYRLSRLSAGLRLLASQAAARERHPGAMSRRRVRKLKRSLREMVRWTPAPTAREVVQWMPT